MAIRSFRSREFRRCLEALPQHVQTLAYENFLLWKRDPGHPSLQFQESERWQLVCARGRPLSRDGVFRERRLPLGMDWHSWRIRPAGVATVIAFISERIIRDIRSRPSPQKH